MARIAYSYLRFSSRRQLKSDSGRRQWENGVAYCERMGLVLDTGLNLRDEGLSGWTGANLHKGCLGRFVGEIGKRVKPGSVLVVESLDRIGRQDIDTMLELFMGILRRGVDIHTLTPERQYTKASLKNIGELLEPLFIMARANEESAMKSKRLKDKWANKRQTIREKKLTPICPAWLRLKKDKSGFDLVPQAVALVQRMFRMVLDGAGVSTIVETFNAEGVPNFAHRKTRNGKINTTWNTRYAANILHCRHVLGEYQPHTGSTNQKTRKPIGDPILDYYPRIIDDATFYRVQQTIAGRKHKMGRPSTQVVNLFTGIMLDVQGAPMILSTGGYRRKPVLVSSLGIRRVKGYDRCFFSYVAFEDAFLSWVKELTVRDVMAQSDDTADQVQATEGKIADITARLNKLGDRIATADLDGLDTLINAIKKLEDTKKTEEGKLEALKNRLHTATQSDLEGCQQLIDYLPLLEGKDKEVAKIRLREKIRTLVGHIDVKLGELNRKSHNWKTTTCLAQIVFRSGFSRTIYVEVDPRGNIQSKLIAHNLDTRTFDPLGRGKK